MSSPKTQPQQSPSPRGKGPDGVVQMFTENKNARCKPFYINLETPDEDNQVFANIYGSDIIKFDKTMTEGNIKFVRNKGHRPPPFSNLPPGKSCRFHHTPDGGMFGIGKYSWKDNPLPEYLYSEKCFYNFEFTIIARPGKALGAHQTYSYKIRSRPDKPDDHLRSTIEFSMPNDQKPDPYVYYNYARLPYSKVPHIKQYTKEGKIEQNKWIGTKLVSMVADDRKSHWMGLYVNTDPIDQATGQPKNESWKLKAEYTDKGVSDYKNIPCVWGGMTNSLRIDGYEEVDLFRYSIVEIEKDPLNNPAHLDTFPGQQFTITDPPSENPANSNSPSENVLLQDSSKAS
jgi:hypothetical protein